MNVKALLLKTIAVMLLSASFFSKVMASIPVPREANVLASNQLVDINIVGKVVDENTNTPIPGVTVKVKNGTTTAITDDNGVFKITVPNEQTVLVFTYMGYEVQEQLVGTSKTINIKLKESQSNLGEVIVVGYGTQKKSDVTGSVVRANLDDFRNSPTTNIGNLLQGTVPGLNIGQVNRAGATPSIGIRGAVTLSGSTSVLIILDGVQYTGSLTSINPDDIASIDILKDASATAVYGAQAANGVLLITSRKGTAGKTKISFSSQYATQAPNIDRRSMNREQYLEHVKLLHWDQAFLAPGYTEPNPAFVLASRVDNAMKDASGNILPNDFSWYDEGTSTGNIFDNNLSISGGSDKFNYLLSGSYTRNKGFVNGDIFKRKSLRANVEAKATNWLTVGLQSFGSFINEDGAEPSLSGILLMSPLVLPWDDNGNLKINPYATNVTNPFLGFQADNYDRKSYFFANIYANVQLPIKGLSYRLNFGNNYRIESFNNSNQYDANQIGEASKQVIQYYDYTLDNILTYNRTFNKHTITGTLLYGAVERKNDLTRASSTGFSRITLGYNNLAQGATRFAVSEAWREQLNYQMLRANYSFDSRYLLTATIRRDGFSAFAANNKTAYFPSVSVGWNISNEPFFKTKWIDQLKLRVGYGAIGNQAERYRSLSIVDAAAAYVYGDGGATQFGQQVRELPNPDLRWERTAGINTGLEFSVLKNRISGVFEYYHTRTSDLLYSVDIPVITGFSRIYSNVGQLNNHGVELSLNTKNIVSKNFQWNTTVNFASARNKVIKLLGDKNGDGVEDDLPQSNLFIGQPSTVVFDYATNGIWQIGETYPAGYSAGTLRIVDQNGDGTINLSDKTILGSTAPAFRASMLNNFQYKNFGLSVFLNAVQGGSNGYLANNTPRLVRSDNAIRDNYTAGIDFWSPINPTGKYPRSFTAPTVSGNLWQARSFVRLQDVSLSYKFSGKFMEKIKVQDIRLYVSGRNLYTWTDWEGWDPEIPGQGWTNDGRPVFKGYAVGLNVTF